MPALCRGLVTLQGRVFVDRTGRRLRRGVQLAVAPTPACIRRGRTAGRQRCPDVRVRRSRQPIRDPGLDTLAPHTGTRPAVRPQPPQRERDALTEIAPPRVRHSRIWERADRPSIPREPQAIKKGAARRPPNREVDKPLRTLDQQAQAGPQEKRRCPASSCSQIYAKLTAEGKEAMRVWAGWAFPRSPAYFNQPAPLASDLPIRLGTVLT